MHELGEIKVQDRVQQQS